MKSSVQLITPKSPSKRPRRRQRLRLSFRREKMLRWLRLKLVKLPLRKLKRRKRKRNKRRRKLLLRLRKTDQITLHQHQSQRLKLRNPNQFHQLQHHLISHQSSQVHSELMVFHLNWLELSLKKRKMLLSNKNTEFRKRVTPILNPLTVMTNEQQFNLRIPLHLLNLLACSIANKCPKAT